MGLACGTTHLPQPLETSTTSSSKDTEGDDDWKALLSTTTPQKRTTTQKLTPSEPAEPQVPVAAKAAAGGVERTTVQPSAPSSPSEAEDYGLLDEYVDDLLGIPPQDRPAVWTRPSWQETAASLTSAVPAMVLQDGSKGPALAALPAREGDRVNGGQLSQTRQEPLPATPYLAGVLTGWAEIDRSAVESKVVRESPAPKKRVEKTPQME
mmetsp:Transcript_26702/g.50173  ORF Transcript_26702/g.50173 Transcript_26702/m.50173 type:complete len:209 (-) Transcript_26702:82-708(-)